MKNFLAFVAFFSVLLLGIFLDSLLINWICSFLHFSATWIIFIKLLLWTILSFFTGGIIIAVAFLTAGAIKTNS